jgi:hypothetical protein
MFGRSLSEYLAFQRPVLILIGAVWALRLAFSMTGLPVSGVQFLSVTGVLVLGAVYYGWAVGRKRFGSFKHLYALNLVQGLFSQALVAAAIVLAMLLGRDNIFSIPEFYPPAQGIGVLGLPMPPDGKSWGHALEHLLVAGAIGFPIIGWLLGSPVLLVTSRRGAARTNASLGPA